jgi:hypothetical protein
MAANSIGFGSVSVTEIAHASQLTSPREFQLRDAERFN